MTVSTATAKPLSTNRFATLLERFEAAARSAARSHRRFDALLLEFESAATTNREQVAQSEQRGVSSSERLLKEYESLIEKAKQHQELVAEDFNVLDVMEFVADELRHSMLLAWLLDSDPRRGTHAQGNLGFRLFLQEVCLPLSYADCHYQVRREVSGDESRIDIRVEATGKFIIDIENKIWSDEGDEQTEREWREVQRTAKQTRIPQRSVHALFLTPEGRRPMNPEFQAISYRQIASILDRFAIEARPADVKLFAKHYATALRRYVVIEREKEESEDENTAEYN